MLRRVLSRPLSSLLYSSRSSSCVDSGLWRSSYVGCERLSAQRMSTVSVEAHSSSGLREDDGVSASLYEQARNSRLERKRRDNGPLFDENGDELIKLRRGGYTYKLKEVTVLCRHIPTSVKKLNKLCMLVRQMPVEEALFQLRYARQNKSSIFMQQIGAGVRNAQEKFGLDAEDLYIAKAIPNRGPYIKRIDIKARGRSGMIKRPSTHLTITLRERDSRTNDPWVAPGHRKPGFRKTLKKYKEQHKWDIVPVDDVAPQVEEKEAVPTSLHEAAKE